MRANSTAPHSVISSNHERILHAIVVRAGSPLLRGHRLQSRVH